MSTKSPGETRRRSRDVTKSSDNSPWVSNKKHKFSDSRIRKEVHSSSLRDIIKQSDMLICDVTSMENKTDHTA